MTDQNQILITYKNKLLLSSADLPFEKSEWSIIGETTNWSGVTSKSVVGIVKKITKIQVSSFDKLDNPLNPSKSVFLIRLSDNNVNSIVRADGQRLEFYTLKEAEKLNLTNTTGTFLTSFKTELLTLLSE